MNSPISRRTVLRTTAGAALASRHLVSTSAEAVAPDVSEQAFVDTNVSLFHWPFRRLPLDTTTDLVARLKQLGCQQAWAGSFEAVLHRDVSSVNRRLVEECQRHESLVPIGCVNPTLPGWRQDLEFCLQHPDVRGVRLLPNYHGYEPDDDRVHQLATACAEAQMLVQICVSLEDVRTQPTLVKVPDVDLNAVFRLAAGAASARIQLLNLKPTPAIVAELSKHDSICIDTARVDGTDGVPKLVDAIGADRVLFGSHAPFLIPEASLVRAFESGQLAEDQTKQLLLSNASDLLSASKVGERNG